MQALLPPHDPIEAIGEAYELLLEKFLQKSQQGGGAAHNVMKGLRDDIADLNRFSKDEATVLEASVQRDLLYAAHYLDTTGKELKDWLGFDVELLKHEFWQLFSSAADQTTTALTQLKFQAENAEYHTGEITALGMLVCDQCSEKLHFYKPGHIPPCPKCYGTHFYRQHAES